MADVRANLPLGVEPFLVSDQAVVVDLAINDFMTSLWQAILIILAASFVSLGVRVWSSPAIPLTLAIVFAVMMIVGIDLQRISLGALIIALTLLVDDAMTTVDAMIRRLAAGDSKEQAATFAYNTLAAPMLIGTLITIAGFVPIGFARSAAGEYTFSIFAVVAIALVTSWLVAVTFAPVLGIAILEGAQDDGRGREAERPHAGVSQPARRRDAREVADHRGDGRRVSVAAVYLLRFVPEQFFPASDRPELLVDLTLRQNASRLLGRERADLRDDLRRARRVVVVVSGHEPDLLGAQMRDQAVAVELELVQPLVARRRLVGERRLLDLDLRRRLAALRSFDRVEIEPALPVRRDLVESSVRGHAARRRSHQRVAVLRGEIVRSLE